MNQPPLLQPPLCSELSEPLPSSEEEEFPYLASLEEGVVVVCLALGGGGIFSLLQEIQRAPESAMIAITERKRFLINKD
jgi:hypothetical protein